MNPHATTIFAPAKLTLSLHISGVRDDGYHLIDAEMVSLNLADRVVIEPRSSDQPNEIEVIGPYAQGVPTDRTNLVVRALELCNRTARVTIDKQIPHGGGLGGGSTDAAAILRWAGYDDLPSASKVGADIPFCMIGGRARVQGIGEIVTPADYRPLDVTLVIPPVQVSTPAAYRAFDELTPTPQRSTEINHLERAAISVAPELGAWKRRIIEATETTPILAGSGATWFVYGRHGNALAALGNEGAQIVEASTIPSDPPAGLFA